MSRKDWFIETILPFHEPPFSTNQSDSNENSQCYEPFETKTVKVLDKHPLQKI